MILKTFVVGSLGVNAFIMGCEEKKEAIVIDPAGSEDMLADEISSLGLTLKYIVNTHGHPDHTSGNKRIKQLTGAPVLMHRADDEYFRQPEAVATFRAWGFEPAPPADGFLEDGGSVEFGNLKLDVIHTPGHSPGSVCLIGNGYIVTGDTLFIDGIGRTDLPGGSMDILITTLREKILPLPDDLVVLPGHDYGPRPTDTLGNQKRTNPYLKNL